MARYNTVQDGRAKDRDSSTRSSGGLKPCIFFAEDQITKVDEGYLLLILPPGEVVTGGMAAEAAARVEQLSGTQKLPLLLTLTGVESVSRTARDIFSAARSLSAVAVIGVSPVDRVIANFLLGGETQPCPTRYFSSENDAVNWLKRYAA